MIKKDKKVSLFDMQNLLLLSDYVEDKEEFSDEKVEEKIVETIENKEKKNLKKGPSTLVLIGFTR
jgi:hypothetical protein